MYANDQFQRVEDKSKSKKNTFLILTVLSLLAIALAQQLIKNQNQTEVDASCTRVLENLTLQIQEIDTGILVGTIIWSILASIIYMSKNYSKIADFLSALKVIFYFFTALYALYIIIKPRSILFTQEAKDCAEKFSAVNNLRNVLLPWSFVRYGIYYWGIFLSSAGFIVLFYLATIYLSHR